MPIDLIQWIADVAIATFKHGLSPLTFIIAVTALFRVEIVRRPIRRRYPWLFARNSEVKEYINNQQIIMENQRLMMEHMGVAKCVERIDLSPNTARHLLRSLHREKLFAWIADVFTAKESTTYLKRRKKKMLKKFTSRKFILAIAGCVVIILNDMLDLNVDKDTVFTFAGILATWIATEGVVDATRKTPEVTDAYTTPKDAGNVQDTAN